MKLSPLAGKPAEASMLVNVPRLVTAYYTEAPDPSVPGQRVLFGTSGHRGSAFDRAFNEWHLLTVSQAVCLYRQRQKTDGPLFLGRDTHALSMPALASALEVLAAYGVDVMLAEGNSRRLRRPPSGIGEPIYRHKFEIVIDISSEWLSTSPGIRTFGTGAGLPTCGAGLGLWLLTVKKKITKATSCRAADNGRSTRQFNLVTFATQRRVIPPVQSAQLVQPRLTAKGLSRPIFDKE